MEWREIVNIHKVIREMPEYDKLLRSLYEDAFELNDITPYVDISIEYGEFIIRWRIKPRIPVTVASFRIGWKRLQDNKDTLLVQDLRIKDGFQLKFPPSPGNYIKVYQLGKITEEEKSGKRKD